MLFLTLLQPAQEQQDKLLVMEVINSSYHRITVKTQYQRHQKNLPFTGASGDILSPKKAQASSPSDPGSSFRVNSGALEKIIDQQNEDMYEGIGDMYD